MKGEALWPYALEIYARPGVEAALLELQDDHGQCVPYLLWALWMAANDREADVRALAAAADLARAWQDAAIAPLRRLRRDLKVSRAAGPQARERLRHGVQTLELEAERMLLQMLDEASPRAQAPGAPRAVLARAIKVWGRDEPPAGLIGRLARLAG